MPVTLSRCLMMVPISFVVICKSQYPGVFGPKVSGVAGHPDFLRSFGTRPVTPGPVISLSSSPRSAFVPNPLTPHHMTPHRQSTRPPARSFPGVLPPSPRPTRYTLACWRQRRPSQMSSDGVLKQISFLTRSPESRSRSDRDVDEIKCWCLHHALTQPGGMQKAPVREGSHYKSFRKTPQGCFRCLHSTNPAVCSTKQPKSQTDPPYLATVC